MEYEGYEYTELTQDEMCTALRNRIKEYEARKFQLLMDSKAEALGNNPNRMQVVKQMTSQMSDLDKALGMCKSELAKLEQDSGEENGD